MRAYAAANGMNPPEESRRCWTLNYSESAQFHLDTLPAIPDGKHKRLLLEQNSLPTDWSETAIAITDRDHPQFHEISENWPHSNPKGYADWFRSRMAAVFDARRQQLALEQRADVEEIPEYEIRTPLQHAIQILKRHRDVMFADRSDEKPISIILTTLSVRAYQQETTIIDALYGILDRMEEFIEYRRGKAWVANPTDSAENFADRWRNHPERRAAFYEWLQKVREDFNAIAKTSNRETALNYLEPRIGRNIVGAIRTNKESSLGNQVKSVLAGLGTTVRILLNPPHRQEPPWESAIKGEVSINQLLMRRGDSQLRKITRTNRLLPKEAELFFEASTSVPEPYDVYWQVVNTGREAEEEDGLRGGFDEDTITNGKLVRRETTRYTGRHSIECFIVKDGFLAARSGQFIVNIG